MSLRLRVPTLAPLLGVALLGAAPLAARQAPVTLTHLADIGCAMCGGPEEFGAVRGVAVGAGQVVVADRDAPHLRYFALDGTAAGTAGAEGDGPGEVRTTMAVGHGPGGTAAVDFRASRLMHLRPDGSERGTVRLEAFPLAAAFTPDGEGFAVALADFRAMEASIRTWDADAGWRTLRDEVEGLGLRPPGAMPLFFSLARAPDGSVVVGIGETDYRLTWLDGAGEPVREVVREVPRTARSEAEIERLREDRHQAAVRRGVEGGGGEAPPVDPLRRHFSVDALRFDEAGRLWVRTDRGVGVTIFDVFDAAGRFLGPVEVPGRIQAFGLGDGHLATVVLDEFDLATVRVWKVDPAGG